MDSAFSVSGTWHSLFIASSFVLAGFLCPRDRVHIALAVLAAAVLGYVAVEVAHWRSLKNYDRTEHHYMLVNNADPPAEREGEEEEGGVGETELGVETKEVSGEVGGRDVSTAVD